MPKVSREGSEGGEGREGGVESREPALPGPGVDGNSRSSSLQTLDLANFGRFWPLLAAVSGARAGSLMVESCWLMEN